MLLLFESTHAVIRAEKRIREEGLPCKVIPVPRTISPQCGMGLEVDHGDGSRLKELLIELGLPLRTHDTLRS